jgi:hypothetical protein
VEYAEGVFIVGKGLQDAEEVLTSLVGKKKKKYDGIRNKRKKDKMYDRIMQPYSEHEHVKLGTYGFEKVKDWDISW